MNISDESIRIAGEISDYYHDPHFAIQVRNNSELRIVTVTRHEIELNEWGELVADDIGITKLFDTKMEAAEYINKRLYRNVTLCISGG